MIGPPDAVRAATALADDLSYEVHEYRFPNNIHLAITEVRIYWLHYLNGKLLYWGREGDFSGAPKEIMEIRMKTGNNINLK